MLTKKQVTQIKRAATRVANAEVEYAWRGAGHPEDEPAIERERQMAKANLNRILADLTKSPPRPRAPVPPDWCGGVDNIAT